MTDDIKKPIPITPPGPTDNSPKPAQTHAGPTPAAASSAKDYLVGYKRPPHRFVKGEVTNPAGRPRVNRPQNFDDALDEALERMCKLRRGGRAEKMTEQARLYEVIKQDARKGDRDALDLIRKISRSVEKAKAVTRKKSRGALLLVPTELTAEEWAAKFGPPPDPAAPVSPAGDLGSPQVNGPANPVKPAATGPAAKPVLTKTQRRAREVWRIEVEAAERVQREFRDAGQKGPTPLTAAEQVGPPKDLHRARIAREAYEKAWRDILVQHRSRPPAAAS